MKNIDYGESGIMEITVDEPFLILVVNPYCDPIPPNQEFYFTVIDIDGKGGEIDMAKGLPNTWSIAICEASKVTVVTNSKEIEIPVSIRNTKDRKLCFVFGRVNIKTESRELRWTK